MRIAIVAGGTGGHFYPGLAVAKKAQQEGHDVFFFLKKGDLVIPFLKKENFPFVSISAGGVARAFSLRNVATLVKLMRGFFESRKALTSNRPDVLLAMGGYLSVPPALAARSLSIPVFLHEQNAKPGWANRFLSKLSKRVAVSFEASLPIFGAKGIWTGNPVRETFFRLPSRQAAHKTWG